MFQCDDRLIDAAIVRKACRSWIDHENSCCWAARRPIDGSAHGLLDIPSKMNGGLTIYTATLRMKHLMDMLVPGKLYTEDFLAAISLFRILGIEHSRASGNIKPDWRVQHSGHVITQGLQIAEIQATAPGYPSIIPGPTLGGITVINGWRQLADLAAYLDASPIENPSSPERERAFENAVSGGFSSMKWLQGSLEYTKAYQAWLEWFVSSEVALAKSCKQIIQDLDELIRQTSERRRFIVTSDGQVGFGPGGAEKGDVVVIIPGGKIPYFLRRVGHSVE
ncbi:hypothetical protein NW760_011900 [Fusarium oxysporum]|nr:hypothetical protein NW760_011900 [Fusarium oxysporum]